MKVIIAIDSFKGSISSNNGSTAISSGIKEVYPLAEIITLPLADGGEGTVEAMVQATEGQLIEINVQGPLRDKVDATYGILNDGSTAVIEIAAACGLPMIPMKQRDPSITTTYGVGEIISDAIRRGCRDFIIGLGGSATNAAGIGMLQALGYRFLDQDNNEVGFGGKVLVDINEINTDFVHPELKHCTFKIACDIQNALYGPNGAAYVFGPQKGATQDMVEELDRGLHHFAQLAFKKINKDIQNISGAGAAGGLGAAFYGFLNGQLQSGVELIIESTGMDNYLHGADFVITGEGMMDGQTSMGKAPLGVAKIAKQHRIPVIALAGGITKETANLNQFGISSYYSILHSPMTIEER